MLLSHAMSDGWRRHHGRADRWSRITGAATGRGIGRRRHIARPCDRSLRRPGGCQAMARRYRPSRSISTSVTATIQSRVLRRHATMRRPDVVVLIHDLIPLTHPDIVPAKQPSRVSPERIAREGALPRLVVAVSEGHRKRRFRGALVRIGPHAAGHRPSRDRYWWSVPLRASRLKSARGRFLMVGTLEPRKNHAVVLDAWEGLAGDMAAEPLPRLQILGQPGWCGAEIAARIRAHPGYGTTVFLDTAACDRTLRAAYSEADTLLYPIAGRGVRPSAPRGAGSRIAADLRGYSVT
jgi:glycosyltransferase involved in cell wall biosynthesis